MSVARQLLIPNWRSGGFSPVSHTVTTTAPAQTVTFQELNSTSDFDIDWGDGNSETISANTSTPVTHVYATADTYTVTWSGDWRNMVELDVRDSKIALNFNSADFTNLTFLLLDSLSSATVTFDSQYHTPLTYLYLNSFPSATVLFDSQHHTSLTTLYLNNLSSATVTFDSQYHTSLTYLLLSGFPSATVLFDSQHHTSLTNLLLNSLSSATVLFDSQHHTSLTNLYLDSLSSTTILFNSQYHTSLTFLRLNGLSSATVTFDSQYHTPLTYLLLGGLSSATVLFDTTVQNWLTMTTLLAQDANVSSAQVDNVLINMAAQYPGRVAAAGTITLNGASNGARTAASDAAVATLTGNGWTVVTV